MNEKVFMSGNDRVTGCYRSREWPMPWPNLRRKQTI